MGLQPVTRSPPGSSRVYTVRGGPAPPSYPAGTVLLASQALRQPLGGAGIRRRGREPLCGRTRSAVLIHAARPGRHTTSTIARALGISVSSSSEHPSALRAAGLVSSRRDGGSIVHHATALFQHLVDPHTAGAGPG